MGQENINVALVGNPNSGKTSLFNALTGLNQKVGNFPGVTVDRKTGTATLSSNKKAQIIDLPGTYSLYPKSADEYVAYETLLNPNGNAVPDVIVIVADATMLQRNLLFSTQIIDLQKPVILVLTMVDLMAKQGSIVDVEAIQKFLGVPVLTINPRERRGIENLKEVLADYSKNTDKLQAPFLPITCVDLELLFKVKQITGVSSDYGALHLATSTEKVRFLSEEKMQKLKETVQKHRFSAAKVQGEEIAARFKKIGMGSNIFVKEDPSIKASRSLTEKIDKILIHRVWGNVFLMLVLLLMFQSIFWLASYPMDWVETAFTQTGNWFSSILPEAWWSNLLINGIWAGLGGVVIFVPQIAILFGIITILEDTGYMARITFLTDRLMRAVGMNGRASMPLISGLACAIPAIMATRIIENRKERLIAILVTPLMSCSARLPVYIILISLVIPKTLIFGFISIQGLVMMGLYLLGFVMALVVSKVLSWVLKGGASNLFLMELPVYRAPRWKNAFQTMYEKAKIFVVDAGKIIMVISVILWALASYGPGNRKIDVEARFAKIEQLQGTPLSEAQKRDLAEAHLENSYIGIMGKAIEPAIQPLGYDWRIGIALITSFAAREAYVGTIATLYSVGSDADENSETLREKMANAKWPDGRPVYTLASGMSLLIFYVFAMQCMSTLAIVKRETKTWKWPVFQFIYMSGLAYLCAFIAYQILK